MKNKFILLVSLLAPSLILSMKKNEILEIWNNEMSKEEQLWKSIRYDNERLLQSALGVGKNPLVNVRDETGITPLHYAAINFRTKLIPFLLAAGAEINDHQNHGEATPLVLASNCHWGSKQEQIETVKLLLSCNADPRIQDKQERTPLTVAKLYGNKPIISLLEEKLASYAEVSTDEEISIKQEEQTVLRRSLRLQLKTEKK